MDYCRNDQIITTSSNGNIFRVTGPLGEESTSHRLIPLTKASGADIWCFRWSAPEQMAQQTISDLRRHRSHYDVTVTCCFRCEVNWYLNICSEITHNLYLIHMSNCFYELSSTRKILSMILKNVVWSAETYSKLRLIRQSKFENIMFDSVVYRMIIYYASYSYTTHWPLRVVEIINV